MKKKLPFLFSILIVLSCHKREKAIINIQSIEFYEKANNFYDSNNYDSAFYYYNKVLTSNTDTLLMGKATLNMAITQSIKGDYFGSNESALNAITFFRDTNKLHLANIYNTIAVNYSDLKEYQEAINWYKKSLPITGNDKDSLMFENNLAVAQYKIKNYDSAKNIYQKMLKDKNVIINPRILTKVIDNLAYTRWLENNNYYAAFELLKAAKIRKKDDDLWGLNASYAHLSDYYSKKKTDSAIYYALEMARIAQKLNSPDDQIEALTKLIRLSPAKSSQKYFERYYNLSDSLLTARNAAKNQFAVIRYQTEKHKADNLILQKENSERKYQIIIISSTALFVLLGGIFWHRKRKRDIETLSQKAITDSKLKTSKKVHDVVANGLYRVMTEIENQQDLDRDLVLDKIEDLYEKSRDISYEKPTQAKQPFHEILSEILTSFATEHRKVLIAGNDAELWLKVSEQTKYELEHIIQELMVNMKKHSQASNVVMRFENNGEQIKIYYTDNGVGMPKDKGFNNGLRNTGNRIEEINGAIIFDTEVEKGLKIQISFPIS